MAISVGGSCPKYHCGRAPRTSRVCLTSPSEAPVAPMKQFRRAAVSGPCIRQRPFCIAGAWHGCPLSAGPCGIIGTRQRGLSFRAHQRRNLPAPGDSLGRVAPVREGILIALWCSRRHSAVQPAAAVRHRRRPAPAAAPRPRAASRAAVHGQSALHGVDPSISRDPHPPPAPQRRPLPAHRNGRGRAPP